MWKIAQPQYLRRRNKYKKKHIENRLKKKGEEINKKTYKNMWQGMEKMGTEKYNIIKSTIKIIKKRRFQDET